MIHVILLLAAAGTAGQAIVPDCKLAPGWQQLGGARSYDTESLYEYMDGNSEGYFIYGFKKMNGVSCKKGEDVIHIDVSDMGDAESAYGMFTANRDPKGPAELLGMGGQIVPRKVIFAKDRYYLEIAAEPDKDHTATLRELALALDKRVPGRDTPPDALKLFPTEGLEPGMPRLIPQSVLGYRALKRGYVAQYADGTKAFLVPVENADDVKAAFTGVIGKFSTAAEAGFTAEAYTGEDKYIGVLCMFHKGKFVGGYVGHVDKKTVEGLAEKLFQRLP